MARADYFGCAVCDGKAFYDAEIDWKETNAALLVVICRQCAPRVEVVRVHERPDGNRVLLHEFRPEVG